MTPSDGLVSIFNLGVELDDPSVESDVDALGLIMGDTLSAASSASSCKGIDLGICGCAAETLEGEKVAILRCLVVT